MNSREFVAVVVCMFALTACSPQPKETVPLDIEAEPAVAEEPSPTPFPMANGVFTGAPQDFLLSEGELDGLYTAADAGSETPNSAVLAGRPDGEAYLAATGRLSGWRIQFDRVAEGESPLYVVNVVNIYETAEGAQLTLSREWHADVWALIDSGQLTLLPEIPNLGAEHLVWQDANGTVGVELAYRNLYIFLTGPADGGDSYQFFADLAKAHIEWIMAGE